MAKQYSNRTDLQNPAKKIAAQAAKGQTYGEAGKQMEAQRAVPMAAPPTDSVPRMAPGSMGAFNRPTEIPLEPVTAGANLGMGPSSAQAGIYQAVNTGREILDELIVLNEMFPNDDLANLIAAINEIPAIR